MTLKIWLFLYQVCLRCELVRAINHIFAKISVRCEILALKDKYQCLNVIESFKKCLVPHRVHKGDNVDLGQQPFGTGKESQEGAESPRSLLPCSRILLISAFQIKRILGDR
ncbi:hypothetical protein L1987_27093 [Smallanthus sonchifolius]|uniref:Uncharacterized protein n=1 Tax=Smallanthus sonchifolius TaxID=185202 RepID=A0ACB9IAR2_9ASTR|nr:hypothetical protein L1987_27093 [Smallanthus sonchifolius]